MAWILILNLQTIWKVLSGYNQFLFLVTFYTKSRPPKILSLLEFKNISCWTSPWVLLSLVKSASLRSYSQQVPPSFPITGCKSSLIFILRILILAPSCREILSAAEANNERKKLKGDFLRRWIRDREREKRTPSRLSKKRMRTEECMALLVSHKKVTV